MDEELLNLIKQVALEREQEPRKEAQFVRKALREWLAERGYMKKMLPGSLELKIKKRG